MKVTKAKIEANRRNAQLSTGPKTPEGKAAVRYNVLKHGILAKEVVIAVGDGREDGGRFEELLSGLPDELNPLGVLKEMLVEKIAVSFWRLGRRPEATPMGHRPPAYQLPLLKPGPNHVKVKNKAKFPLVYKDFLFGFWLSGENFYPQTLSSRRRGLRRLHRLEKDKNRDTTRADLVWISHQPSDAKGGERSITDSGSTHSRRLASPPFENPGAKGSPCAKDVVMTATTLNRNLAGTQECPPNQATDGDSFGARNARPSLGEKCGLLRMA